MPLLPTRLKSRFALLLAICVMACAIPAAVVVTHSVDELRATQRERDGIAPARALIAIVRLTQEHRGLSNLVLNGDAQSETRRRSKQEELREAHAHFDALLAADLARGSRLLASWQAASALWAPLGGAVDARQLTPQQSYAQHTALVAALLSTLDEVPDHWGLNFESNPGIYALITASLGRTPAMIELAGQSRARGAALLARAEAIAPTDKVRFEALKDGMATAHAAMSAAYARSASHSRSEFGAKVSALTQRFQELGERTVTLARDAVITPEVPTMRGADYFARSTEAIDGMYAALNDALALLDGELQLAQAERQRDLVLVTVGMLALLVLAVGFAMWMSRRVRADLGAEPDAVRLAVGRMADGHLTAPLTLDSGDGRSVMAAVQRMQTTLAQTVAQVRGNADAVATASAQIALGNQDLSQRTEQQASALEQTAASMAQLGATVRQNASHAQEASALASGANDVAAQGGVVVDQVVAMMRGMNDSSQRIVDILAVIDGIAFQTNILALNAAVEAARAGEQGRGFAVVAGEVRTLAQRSGEAAKEIRVLIGDSAARVEQGTQLVDSAGRTMAQVVTSIASVTELMGQIATASREQSEGVAQMGQAVTQMDQVTQQNAALVEQSAAAAQSLREQADRMVQTMAVFKL